MQIEQQAMLSLLPTNLSGQTCLDLACGSGRYIQLLQQRQAGQVIGLDYSPNMLARAMNYQLTIINCQLSIQNRKSKIENPKLLCAPFFPLPFAANTFDFITCGLAVGHEKTLTRTLAEAARVLRPGGLILYSDVHPLSALLG